MPRRHAALNLEFLSCRIELVEVEMQNIARLHPGKPSVFVSREQRRPEMLTRSEVIREMRAFTGSGQNAIQTLEGHKIVARAVYDGFHFAGGAVLNVNQTCLEIVFPSAARALAEQSRELGRQRHCA